MTAPDIAMNSKELTFHEIANVLPLLTSEELDELAVSIRANGLREPITLHEGKILDGRNRWLACRQTNVEARFETYEGDDPIGFVIDKNLQRRHLSESQRAMIAAKLAKLRRGHNQYATSIGLSHAQAAKVMNVGVGSVMRAAVVLRRGTKEQVAAIDAGDVKVRAIADDLRAKSLNKNKAEMIIWENVRDALLKLANLSRPAADVVPILRSYDKDGLVAARLPKALSYLQQLSNTYESPEQK